MSLSAKRREELEKLCRQFRIDLIDTIYHVQSGHPGGSLSACEIMAVLYTEKMNIDPKEPNKPDRDRLIMSKGHASPVLYRAMAEAGYFPLSEMANLRKIGGILQGHPSMHTPGVDMPHTRCYPPTALYCIDNKDGAAAHCPPASYHQP